MTQPTPAELVDQQVDERKQVLINEACFFEAYKPELQELFMALDRSDQWSDDPRTITSYTNPAWVGQEHGNSTEKDQFSDEQAVPAMPILRRMGLVDETLPPFGMHFDDVLVVGGTTQANYRRESVWHKAVREQQVTADRVTLWLGQRAREARDGTTHELLSTTRRFPGNDILDNRWVRTSMDQNRWEQSNKWGLSETELGRIAMLKLASVDMPHRINLELTDLQNPHQQVRQKLEGVPPRIIESYEFTDEEGQEYVAMNVAAVPRENGGLARHTTRACAIEWLEKQIPREGANVLFISSNPHTDRTAQDTMEVLQEYGRGDINLVLAGASAPNNAPIQLFLGEVGRLLHNDVKRNYGEA